ncbi:hypothetical protein BU17DRAFT_96567 [Hysterangium stoloniferum]|nr:hypothetical protein BU17DRAFT_96567 [Hysterangium stoloniferum]
MNIQLDKNIFPAYNLHSFIFSNPFSPSSPIVRSLNDKLKRDNTTYPPITPRKQIFYDPTSSTAITYERLRRDTLRLAHGIRQRFGVPQTTDAFGSGSCAGPVVLVQLPNCLVWPVVALGFIAAGWTVTGISPANTALEIAHFIKLCEPRIFICQEDTGGENQIRSACKTVGHRNADFFFVDPIGEWYGQLSSQRNSWTSLLSNEEFSVPPLIIILDALDGRGGKLQSCTYLMDFRLGYFLYFSRNCLIIITIQGTTGKPKGAMLTHRSVVASLILTWLANPGYSPNETWIAAAPFYHVFGLEVQLLTAACIGATVIVLPKFDLEEYLRIATIHRVTHLHIVPPIAVQLAKSDLLDQPWCSLKSVVAASVAGAPLSPEIITEVWKRVGIVVKMIYGMTETGPITSITSNTWPDVEARLGSCGRPLYSLEVRILGPDGKYLTDGKSVGEIIIRTPGQLLGYIKSPEATAEVLHGDGVHTGDLGYIDGTGDVRILGRSKELIKYKGFQVSPSELEALIGGLSQVRDVAVSSRYAEAQATELPMAYVTPRSVSALNTLTNLNSTGREVPAELIALAEEVKAVVEKNLIHYKRLRGGVVFVLEIPKSPSGKIRRELLNGLKGIFVDCYHGHRESKL